MNRFEQIQSLEFPAPLPPALLEIEQHFDTPRVADVAQAAREALERSRLLARVKPGASVAVGVGSRGIADIAIITRAVIDTLRAHGAQPFVVPAMGSHGGATAEGQRATLAEYGVTAESVGAEIRATMEAREIGRLADGPALYQDANAAAADHTLLISRIKPHTDFHGELESGPAKMCLIGLGKQRGATEMHVYGGAGFRRWLGAAARIYEANTNVLGAVAILENACSQIAEIVALGAAEIGAARETELLQRARALMPSLPFPEVDVLVVRQIGKDISGTGMDTNVVNRMMLPREPERGGAPDVAIIVTLDLTNETRGNGMGVGMASVVPQRIVDKIDWASTYTNAITSGIFGMLRNALPITMANDLRALQVAVRGCARPYHTARFVFIRDTLTLDRLWVSPNLRPEIQAHPRLSIVGETPLSFGADGAMISPWKLD